MSTHPRDLPPYDHDELTECFDALERELREHSTSYVRACRRRAIAENAEVAAHRRDRRSALLRAGRALVPGGSSRVGAAELIERCNGSPRGAPASSCSSWCAAPTMDCPRSTSRCRPRDSHPRRSRVLRVDDGGPMRASLAEAREIGVYVPEALPDAYVEVAILVPTCVCLPKEPRECHCLQRAGSAREHAAGSHHGRVRVRAKRQPITDAVAFRAQMRSCWPERSRKRSRPGTPRRMRGWPSSPWSRCSTSPRSTPDAALAEWARRPLQAEMFGGHMGGEWFFQHVEQLLARPDSPAARRPARGASALPAARLPRQVRRGRSRCAARDVVAHRGTARATARTRR